jgi:hypothetical protein
MRYLMLGAVLILSMAAPVRADVGLTDAVAAAYFPRTVDEGLHAIAHQRVIEISACGCLEHNGMRPGTAEVLVWNLGQPNPVASALGAWRGSPTHNAILSDRQYGLVGCAERTVGGTHWFACVLAAGPLPAPPPAPLPAPPVLVLPDTAMP